MKRAGLSRSRWRAPRWVWLFLLPWLAVGCGPKTTHVSGKVLQKNGEPLPGGLITFTSKEGSKLNPASGTVQADGSFDLSDVPMGPVLVTIDNRGLKNPPSPPVGLGGQVAKVSDKASERVTAPEQAGGGGPPRDAMKDKKVPTWKPPGQLPGQYVEINSRYYSTETTPLSLEVNTSDQKIDIKLE
jgi:hypothetical protein